jgi:hypothetical protein
MKSKLIPPLQDLVSEYVDICTYKNLIILNPKLHNLHKFETLLTLHIQKNKLNIEHKNYLKYILSAMLDINLISSFVNINIVAESLNRGILIPVFLGDNIDETYIFYRRKNILHNYDGSGFLNEWHSNRKNKKGENIYYLDFSDSQLYNSSMPVLAKYKNSQFLYESEIPNTPLWNILTDNIIIYLNSLNL